MIRFNNTGLNNKNKFIWYIFKDTIYISSHHTLFDVEINKLDIESIANFFIIKHRGSVT